MAKNMKVLKGGRKRDIYEDAKWKKRPLDINGETQAGISFCDPIVEQMEGDEVRYNALEIIRKITDDPLEHKMAELMLENYTESDIAYVLNVSPARGEWFMRKIGGWKRNI
jgi:hypothetical protein